MCVCVCVVCVCVCVHARKGAGGCKKVAYVFACVSVGGSVCVYFCVDVSYRLQNKNTC